MISALRKIFSFQYDDSPMDDRVYRGHDRWLRFITNVYHRVEHHGCIDECLELMKKERVILISNHAILLEAALINHFIMIQGAGLVSTLVYREAFKIPLVREFFRSCQCVPISVENGTKALKKRHVLIFPEGMDFINGFVNPDRVPAFHKGFLRMAKAYLRASGKKSVAVIPVAHAGLEHAVKLWVIKNKTVMDLLIRPIVNYPYLVIPKLPFILPTKVHIQWGMPVRLTLSDLRTERKISQRMNEFRKNLLNGKLRAQYDRDTALI